MKAHTQRVRQASDESGNVYKQVMTQNHTPEGEKLTTSYFLNGKEVTRYDAYLVQEWLSNHIVYFS